MLKKPAEILNFWVAIHISKILKYIIITDYFSNFSFK